MILTFGKVLTREKIKKFYITSIILYIIQILILFKYLFYSNTYFIQILILLLFKYLFKYLFLFIIKIVIFIIQILILFKYLFYLLFKYDPNLKKTQLLTDYHERA